MNIESTVEKLTSVSFLKPKRQDFKKIIITDKSGHTISPDIWADRVRGHRPGVVMRKEGFARNVIFNQEEYEKTKNAYYILKHAHEKALVKSMIDEAFELSGVERTKKAESVLTSILPVMKKNLSTNEIIHKFSDMIKLMTPDTKV